MLEPLATADQAQSERLRAALTAQAAEQLGLSESETQASLALFLIEQAAAGLETALINPALIHHTQ